jgi:arylsulfatase A-like enzyme/Flp pilus assembly protein TadD
MRAAAPVAALAAALAATTAPGCSTPRSPGVAPRRVVLITLDTTRADRIGCYGYAGAATPTLDRLASGGVLFANAVAPTPITLPSHATLFTGAYPARHGVRNNGTFRLGADLPTLAERFRAAGYSTAAVIGSAMLDSRYGLDRGFDLYDDSIPPLRNRDLLVAERTASEVTRRALDWAHGQGERRWFMWVHYFDPHYEYAAPEPFASRFKAQPYDGEIAYVDSEVGRLLDGLGSPSDTLVAVAGDHGESLGEHGERSHGIFIYAATQRVPLLLAWGGGLPGGSRIEGVVSLADVAPTLAEIARLEPLEAAQGDSLLAAIRSGEPPRRPVLIESWLPRLNYGWSELTGIQDERWKFIRAPRPELYDLAADPGEIRNLAPAEPSRAEDYAARLDETLKRHGVPQGADPSARASPADPETLQLLRSLGYLGAGEAAPAGEGEGGLPDPKDRIGEFLETSEALLLMAAGRVEEAVERLEAAERASPGSVLVRRQLGNAYRRMGRLREAEQRLREAVRLSPHNPGAILDLAAVILERSPSAPGAREAESLALRALDLNPTLAGAHHLLGAIQDRRGNPAAAASRYRRALEIDPDSAATLGNLAILLEARGELDEALSLYLRAAQADPGNPRPLTSAAWLHYRRGRLEESARLLRRAAEEAPASAAPLGALAQVLEKAGDSAGALAALSEAVTRDPRRPELWRDLALLQIRSGDPCAARTTLESSPSAHPAELDRARRECSRARD